jgi:CRP-like cAMP-binding protein
MTSNGDQVHKYLLSAEWLQLLPQVSRDRVLIDAYERTYQQREFVARQGEPAATWLGVMDGLLKVSTVTPHGKSVMFTAVPGGSWIGEGSVLKREPRKYDVIALRTTRVVHVPRATFLWLLDTSNDFARYVIDHLNERAGQFIAMFEVGRITEPAARVAGAIVNLFNPVLYPRAGPLVNISQEEMGELAGLSRTTTNAAISKLKKLRLVRPEYGGLLVLDLDQLRHYVFVAGCDPAHDERRQNSRRAR